MKKADMIRAFAKDHYIDPAREKGESIVSIKAGEVHSLMLLSQSLPAVCSALETDKFETLCNLKRKEIIWPVMGSTTTFVYEILD